MDNSPILCPLCISIRQPDRIDRWDLMAHMILESDWKPEHPKFQERTLAFYLQAAFERGLEEGKRVASS
jgi:hypothetical protein